MKLEMADGRTINLNDVKNVAASLKFELANGRTIELNDVKKLEVVAEPLTEYGPYDKNIREVIDTITDVMYYEVNALDDDHGRNSYLVQVLATALSKFECVRADAAAAEALELLRLWKKKQQNKASKIRRGGTVVPPNVHQEAIDDLIEMMNSEVNDLDEEDGNNDYLIVSLAAILRKFKCVKANDMAADALSALASWERDQMATKKRRVTS